MNKKWFWLVIIALHSVFFAKQVFFQTSYLQDSKEYIYAADNLINYHELYAWNHLHAFNNDWMTRRPFLYPVILSFFKLLSFNNTILFVFLTLGAQNLLSLWNIRSILNFISEKNIKINYVSTAFFLIFSLSQFIYSNLIMSEIWLQTVLLGIFLLANKTIQSFKNHLYISALLIAAMALKPVMMPFAFIYPIILIIKNRKIFNKEYLVYLLPLLFYFGTCKINEYRTGYFHYSSMSTFNMLHYNTYVTLMNDLGPQKADSIIDKIKAEAGVQGSYKASQLYTQKKCAELLQIHAKKYTYLHARGIAFSLFDPGRFDITQFFNLPHSFNLIYLLNQGNLLQTIKATFLNPLGLILILLILFNSLRTLTVFRFIFNKNFGWQFKLNLIILPAYVLILTGPIGTSRFFMPLIPFALIAWILIYSIKKEDKVSNGV